MNIVAYVIFFFSKINYYAYTGLLLVLLKEGQVYPVPPLLLPLPACGPLFLHYIVDEVSYFPPNPTPDTNQHTP